ncbi:dynein axonemal light chain 4-like [Diachasmimorpha longicaudata]|uniref:dynein axonemal light chain 4-like n=1 Tax=Diachasmimorpha longicaudata TaxID=58733 RepID=UPI0030B8D2C0
MATGEVKKEVIPPVFHTYPVCKSSDMPEEMKQEALELCVTATEKFSDNYKHAAKMIKDDLDKKFGPPFQVIIGESYGFSVIYQRNSMMLMYTGGNIAVLIFRTVAGFNS